MSESPWKQLERELNPRQREAVFASDSHVLVLAGPGTGKTRTLVNRIVYLGSVAGEDPSSILALTFTRKAARNMVDRLAGYLEDGASRVTAGTFHHFGVQILRQHADRAGLPSDFAVADEERQLAVLRRAWNRLGVSAREPEAKEKRLLLGRFGQRRAEGKAAGLSALQEELFQGYLDLLRAEKAIDFDDILDLTRRLLREDGSLRAELQQRWRHVLVDEFQDTDALQYEILRLLVPAEGRSFLVADDQQSIYAWRGARPENLEHYRRDYGPREIVLDENYRNREAILAGARALLSGEGGPARELVSKAGGAGSLRLEHFPDEAGEAAFLAADIKRARSRRRGTRWRDVAVLYPKHSIGEYLEGRLMAERIPVEMVAGRGLLEQPRIRQALALLRLIRQPADEEALETLLSGRLDEGAYSLLRRLARARGDSWRQALAVLRRLRETLRDESRRWSRFQARHSDLSDEAWMAAWNEEFPGGFASAELLPKRGGETDRRGLEEDGEILRRMARLGWQLDEIIAGISNFRAGHRGKSLSQLLREILVDLEEGEGGALPGDPGKVEGLAAIHDRLRALLREGRPVQIGAAEARQEVLLAEMLRLGLEPWYRRLIVPAGKEPTAGPRLRLDLDAGALVLEEDRERLRATGASAPLLLFRLHQLIEAAEYRPLEDYVVFDLETTGVDTARCEIIEIAAIRFEGGREVSRFKSLVRPAGPIPAEATAVHGITDSMVAGAPLPGPVLNDFFRFAGSLDLVAHNGSGFDWPVLSRVAREQGLSRPRPAVFDTLALARQLFPRKRNRLEDLIERFGIRAESRHRALDDCRCLAEAFEAMQKQQLGRLARRAGREALAPLALALFWCPEGPPRPESGEAYALFRRGVRRLLASGSPWLDLHALDDERSELEGDLLAAAGLEGDAPELFQGRRSEEERFLALLPSYDELFLGDSLASFLDFLALYQAPDFAQGQDAVQLMTIHAAKGLEFDEVYIAGLEENVLPGYYALRSGDEKAVEEERRLLYVAMTRAARSLTLCRVDQRGGFAQEPSRFLQALKEVLP